MRSRGNEVFAGSGSVEIAEQGTRLVSAQQLELETLAPVDAVDAETSHVERDDAGDAGGFGEPDGAMSAQSGS